MPLITFVTAYDEYAVRAFEVNAVDYLLKPVAPDRFRAALARARDRLQARVPLPVAEIVHFYISETRQCYEYVHKSN